MINDRMIKTIKLIREEKGIKQNEMAVFLNTTPSNYSTMESGKSGMTLENFIEICKILEINPAALINENNKTFILNERDVEVLKEAKELLDKINRQVTINQTFNINNLHNEGNMIIGNKIDKKD